MGAWGRGNTIVQYGGESWYFHTAKPTTILNAFQYKDPQGDPLFDIARYTPGKTNWDTRTVMLWSNETSQSKSQLQAIAGNDDSGQSEILVLCLKTADNKTTKPLPTTLYEGIFDHHLTYDAKSQSFDLWYWADAWTPGNRTNNLDTGKKLWPVVTLEFDSTQAQTFNPNNYFIIPDPYRITPAEAKIRRCLMHAKGRRYLIQDNQKRNRSCLVTNNPELVSHWANVDADCCVEVVKPSSTTKNADGYYPGNVHLYNPDTKAWVTGPAVWILDANG
jgi:hypothetical protein